MFFFFSSRRRHTRYIGDWSSDVCSSDLVADTQLLHQALRHSLGHSVGDALLKEVAQRLVKQLRIGDTICRIGGDERSEERRVGKERRARQGGGQQPQKEETPRPSRAQTA